MDKNTEPYISCKDFTVSGEIFELVYDEHYEMLITAPKPSDDELGKYYESESYISHTDSNKSLFDKVYQLVKTYTIAKKMMLLNSFTKKDDKTLLDVGCGTGDLLFASKNNNWKVKGVEPSLDARSLAESKLSVPVNTSITELQGEKFDCISMWHVLEHVPNLKDYITQLHQLLEDSGTLFVAVPNYKSYDANYYKENWAAYDVPRHLSHFSQKAIKLLFEEQNMRVVKILPMKFDSYYVSMLSEKYKNSKLSFVKGLFVGFLSNFKAIVTGEYSSLIYVIKKD